MQFDLYTPQNREEQNQAKKAIDDMNSHIDDFVDGLITQDEMRQFYNNWKEEHRNLGADDTASEEEVARKIILRTGRTVCCNCGRLSG